MVIQEHGNLSNYVLIKGENKGVTEVREFKSRELIYTKIRHKVTYRFKYILSNWDRK